MTKTEVMALLRENRNERGVLNWEKLGEGTAGFMSFGIGLTQLRKLSKRIGRDHHLALQLWNSDCYDAKIVGLLIDDPGQLTREQVEEQVQGVGMALLAHVFSSCDATLAKAPFVFDLAGDWIEHDDALRRECGYGLIYELSKNKRKAELTDAFFLSVLDRIRDQHEQEDARVRLAMGSALMGIGKRNSALHQVALPLAREIGPIDFNQPGGTCEPFDVVKHLTTEALLKKLGAS